MGHSREEIITALHEGHDVAVILENRFGEGKYKESYTLSDIYIQGKKFVGKFRQVHATDYLAQLYDGQIDNRNPASYGYTNFAPLVCCSSLTGGFARFYSSYAYSTLVFKPTRPYESVWSSESSGDVTALYEAVDAGRKLKVKLDLFEDTSIIVPLHTVEVYPAEKTFNGYTEYDGFPDSMRNFDWVSETAKELSLRNNKTSQYAMTKLFTDIPFWISYFKITPQQAFKVVFEGQPNREEQPLPCTGMAIFAEVF